MMLTHALTEVREAQVPLLSAMLLGGCAAKVARVARVGSVDAGLGPTALFPVRLRRPVALAVCAAEFACGAALIITAGGLGRGGLATAVRLVTSLLFLVATCALIELRTSHPEAGCGCFGDFSTSPVTGRTLARSAFFAVAALATIGLPPLRAPHPGADAARLLVIFAVELVVVAALSPEVGEALVRLGYSEPCELRRLPAVRTLAALRRSSQWRRRAGLITTEVPIDMWRELCWRYVVFPARLGARNAEIVFAVYLRPHRPVVHAALVDSASGGVLPWPVTQGRRNMRSRLFGVLQAERATAVAAAAGLRAGFGSGYGAGPGPGFSPGPAPGSGSRPGSAHGSRSGSDLLRVPAGALAASTDPGRGIPAMRAEPPEHSGRAEPGPAGLESADIGPAPLNGPRTPPDDLPFSSDL
jgi:hypothetical protein